MVLVPRTSSGDSSICLLRPSFTILLVASGMKPSAEVQHRWQWPVDCEWATKPSLSGLALGAMQSVEVQNTRPCLSASSLLSRH